MRLIFRSLDVTLLRIKIFCVRLGFPISLGLSDFERIKHHKGFVMEKQAIKELMFGGIKELMNSRRYYYKSTVSKDYCHFTDEGKVAMHSFIADMARYITEAENAELDQRAKDMVMKELKGG